MAPWCLLACVAFVTVLASPAAAAGASGHPFGFSLGDVLTDMILGRSVIGNMSYNSLTCVSCKQTVGLASYALHHELKRTEELFTIACQARYHTDEKVCVGMAALYGPVLMSVFASRTLNKEFICTRCGACKASGAPQAVDVCDTWPTVNSGGRAAAHASRPRRAGPLTDSAALVEPSSKPVGHFLQLSDIHLDPEYTVGNEATCGKPLCCRKENGRAAPAPLGRAASAVGDYACDTPAALLDGLFAFAGRPGGKVPPLDFVVFTGDEPPHDIWESTQAENVQVIDTVASKLAAAFPGVPVYPVLGNHEGWPADQFKAEASSPDMVWLYASTWSAWARANWLPASARDTFFVGGYYTAVHAPGLRIVALNTQLCDSLNFWLLGGSVGPDPAGQLAWLEEVLAASQAAGESVLILGHIPPSNAGTFVSCACRYNRIVARFATTVIGQLFGHTHHDQLSIQGPASAAFGALLIAPSVTPYTNNDPAFRVFEYLRPAANGTRVPRLLDYSQWRLNLQAAAASGRADGWAVTYTARSAYGLSSLDPASLGSLVGRLGADPWLVTYRTHREGRSAPAACDARCVRGVLCSVESNTWAAYDHCVGTDSLAAVSVRVLNAVRDQPA